MLSNPLRYLSTMRFVLNHSQQLGTKLQVKVSWRNRVGKMSIDFDLLLKVDQSKEAKVANRHPLVPNVVNSKTHWDSWTHE